MKLPCEMRPVSSSASISAFLPVFWSIEPTSGAAGGIAAPAGAARDFFEEHLLPWNGRFFFDLEAAEAADFYASVGSLGRAFVEVETQAFVLPA